MDTPRRYRHRGTRSVVPGYYNKVSGVGFVLFADILAIISAMDDGGWMPRARKEDRLSGMEGNRERESPLKVRLETEFAEQGPKLARPSGLQNDCFVPIRAL